MRSAHEVAMAMVATATAPMPCSTPSTALPMPWTQALFRRLAHLYGHRWTASLPTSEPEMAEMLRTWSQGLAGLDAEAIRRALAELMRREDPWPPSLPELRALCRPTRALAAHQVVRYLPAPKPEPALVAEHLATIRHALGSRTEDPGCA